MDQAAENTPLKRLEPFVGEWNVDATFPGAPPTGPLGRAVFEWMPWQNFLIQRWDVPDPGPDGMAIIGLDPESDGYLQHYFDARGVARVYSMTFRDGVWGLSRTSPDVSPLDFSQRFEGKFTDDGKTIDGRWEISHDGSTWEHDIELTYARVG